MLERRTDFMPVLSICLITWFLTSYNMVLCLSFLLPPVWCPLPPPFPLTPPPHTHTVKKLPVPPPPPPDRLRIEDAHLPLFRSAFQLKIFVTTDCQRLSTTGSLGIGTVPADTSTRQWETFWLWAASFLPLLIVYATTLGPNSSGGLDFPWCRLKTTGLAHAEMDHRFWCRQKACLGPTALSPKALSSTEGPVIGQRHSSAQSPVVHWKSCWRGAVTVFIGHAFRGFNP